MDWFDELNKLQDTLKTQRDELKLKVHLAKMDVQQEWEIAEKQWQHFKIKADEIGAATKESAQEVGAAAKLLGDEVLHAFGRIRKSL